MSTATRSLAIGSSRLDEAADDDGHGRARAAPGSPRRDPGRARCRRPGGVGHVLEDRARTEAGALDDRALRVEVSPTTSGTDDSSGPVETVICDGRALRPPVPGPGLCAETRPSGVVAGRLGDVDTSKPAASSSAPALDSALIEHVGHRNLSEALGDPTSTSVPSSTCSPGRRVLAETWPTGAARRPRRAAARGRPR